MHLFSYIFVALTNTLMTNTDIASSTPDTVWDIPEHLTNGYTRNSNVHSKSTNLDFSDLSTPSSPNRNSNNKMIQGTTNRSKHMKKSFSMNTSLTNFTKNSNWETRSNHFSNSFSLTSISSIFSIADNT